MYYRNVMNSCNTVNKLLFSFLFCFSMNLLLFVIYCYQVILDLFSEFKYFRTNRAHAD